MNAVNRNSNEKHIVIAIGASAGGLQSLTHFFEHIEDDSFYTFVIIQHLSPDYNSFTDELLSKSTKVSISDAVDGEYLEKQHIYVVPSSKNLVLQDKKMKLVDKPKGKTLNLPVDIFFESLAINFKQNAVGIIVSGTG
ncbi:MAG: chemotaxis protein CheB, partial [Nonlabens sp.]